MKTKKTKMTKKTVTSKAPAKSKFQVSDDVIAKRRENGDILLVKLDDNDIYFTINGISVDVWEKLEKGKTLEEIEEALAEKYPNETKAIKTLLKKFTNDLVSKNLLIPCD